MQKIEILWTGGYDSTFRITQLSVHRCIIQPYYLLNQRRLSSPFELEAMAKITDLVNKNPSTLCRLQPLIVINIDDIPQDSVITSTFQIVRAAHPLGTQYDWLARFAVQHPGVELCVVSGGGRLKKFIEKFGKIQPFSFEDLPNYRVDQLQSAESVNVLFGQYHLPLIYTSKLQMQDAYRQLGLQDIAYSTWFCHNPIHAQPCGVCGPCQYAIKAGLSHRLSKNALLRYKKKRLTRLFIAPFEILRKKFFSRHSSCLWI